MKKGKKANLAGHVLHLAESIGLVAELTNHFIDFSHFGLEMIYAIFIFLHLLQVSLGGTSFQLRSFISPLLL